AGCHGRQPMRPIRRPAAGILHPMLLMRVLQRPAGVRAVLLGVAAVLLAVGVTDLAQGKSSAGGAGAPGAAKPGAQGPPDGPRYRIVACASRGTAAYTHGPARRVVAIAFDDGPARDTPA